MWPQSRRNHPSRTRHVGGEAVLWRHHQRAVSEGEARSAAISTMKAPSANGFTSDIKALTLSPRRSRMSLSDESLDGISAEGPERFTLPTRSTSSHAYEAGQDKKTPANRLRNDFAGGDMNIHLENYVLNAGRKEHSPVSEGFDNAETHFPHDHSTERMHQRRGRFKKREAKLRLLRPRNLATRAAAYERRNELREARLKISIADDTFMRLVRKGRTQTLTNQDEVILREYYDQLQSTRDIYGPLEEAYHVLEDRLDREEYELTVLEERLSTYSVSSPELRSSDWTSSSSSESGYSAYSEAKEEMHPLMEKYLFRQGDAERVREAHVELMIERDQLQRRQETRQRLGKVLLLEDQETLASFPTEEYKLLEELHGIEADVELLRQECIQAGVFDNDEIAVYDSSVSSDIDNLEDNEDGYIDLSLPNLPEAEYRRFPLLLEKPADNGDQEASKSLISSFNTGDTGNRIARWLLHKLRSSCGEVELLARFSHDEIFKHWPEGEKNTKTVAKPPENTKWQEEVLDYWYIDSANLPPSAYANESTTSSALPHSPALFDSQTPLSPHLSPSPDFLASLPSAFRSGHPSPAHALSPLSLSPAPYHSQSNSPLPSPSHSHSPLYLAPPSPRLLLPTPPFYPPLPSPSGLSFLSTQSWLDMTDGEVVTETDPWGPSRGRRMVDSATARRIQLTVRSVPFNNGIEQAEFINFGLVLAIKDIKKVLDIKTTRGRRAMSV